MKNIKKLLDHENIFFIFQLSFLPVLIFISSNYLKSDFNFFRNLYYFLSISFINLFLYFFFSKFYSIKLIIKLIFFINIFIFFSKFFEFLFYEYLLSWDLIRPFYFYIFLLIIYFITIKKVFFDNETNLKNFVKNLNKFFIIMISLNLIIISYNLIKRNFIIKNYNLSENKLTDIKLNNIYKKSNIYLIVLDSFQDFNSFKNIVKKNEEEINEFYNYLVSNNFKVENFIRSSSIVSPISMGQILSMNYLIPEDQKYDPNLFYLIQDKWIKNDLPVINILKKRGYNFNYYNSGLIHNKTCNEKVDNCLSRKSFLVEQDLIFLNTTPILRIFAKFKKNEFYYKVLYPGLYEITDFVKDYEKMKIIPNNAEFFYIHGVIPHAPYRFDRNCNYLSEQVIQDEDNNYIEQYLCAIKQAKNLLNIIKSKDNKSIIILLSDHGHKIGGIEGPDYKIRNLTTPQMIQLSSPLFAIKNNQCLIERKIENTINTFRAVFSCLDNKDYDFLESKTILVGYPDWENPFDIFFLKSR